MASSKIINSIFPLLVAKQRAQHNIKIASFYNFYIIHTFSRNNLVKSNLVTVYLKIVPNKNKILQIKFFEILKFSKYYAWYKE